MNRGASRLTFLGMWLLTAVACDRAPQSISNMGEPTAVETVERGPNNGRLLRDGDFVLELAIYETGVPPEFRVWVTDGGRALDPRRVDLRLLLVRLGGQVEEHHFRPHSDFLRGTRVVDEPHSFVVNAQAAYGGRTYRWEYESFEGRTRISREMAEAFKLETLLAGPGVIEETVTVYGRVVPDAHRVREVSARFEGAIRSVDVLSGETVNAGQPLATVESNESLQPYTIKAPIAGAVTERVASAGEQTGGRRLFTIVDTSSVWAELSVFPGDRSRIGMGTVAHVTPAAGGPTVQGPISFINVFSDDNQAVTARVVLDNSNGLLPPGTFVTAQLQIGRHRVPLAVKRSALQSFRDFTVVYEQIGDEYEVRMLELGRGSEEWVEVLGGLAPGSRYVSENSYVLKADIEKSGAAHDH